MRRIATIALVLGVVAVVIVVAAASFSSDEGSVGEGALLDESGVGDELMGAHLPPKNVLPGTLWFVSTRDGPTDTACQLRAIALSDLSLGKPGLLDQCTLIDVSLDGRYAVTADATPTLTLLDLDGRPETSRSLSPVSEESSGARFVTEAAIAPDGSRVAWCSAENETTVLTIEAGSETRSVGCDPRFDPSGALVTRTLPPQVEALYVEGQELLDEADFRAGLDLDADGEASLLAYDIGDDGSVATKVRRFLGEPQPTVQVWDDGRLAGHYRVRGIQASLAASGVELSPNARGVALGWTSLLAGVLDVTVDRMVFTFIRGPYAWSPDGEWLAIGEGPEVAIYARGSEAPTYSLPVRATALRWSN